MNKAKTTRIGVTAVALLFLVIAGANFVLLKVYYGPSTDDCLWAGADEGMRITGIVPDGAADKAGIKDGDILLKINGKEFSNPFQAQSHIDSLPEGRTARYTVRRGGQLLELDVPLRKLPTVFSAVSTGVGFVFLLTGYLVIIFNPLKRLSRFFFYLCFITFVFLSLNQVAVPGYILLFQIMNILRLVFIAMWGPAMLHFFLVFPSRKAFFVKYPRLIYLIYLPPLAVVTLIFTGFPQIGRFFNYLIGLYVGLSCASFITSYVKVKEKKEKIPLRIILWGLFLGMVPLGLLVFLPNVVVGLIGNTAVFVAFGMMTFLPISFGYAVMKYGLMDVGIVIKKGIVYSATTGFFILLYMGLVVGVGGTLARNIGVKSEILNALFIAVVALALNPVKIRVQEFVDKRFYPQKYTYRQMLLNLSRDLPTHLNLDEILKNVSETLKTAMQVEESVISVFESEGKTFRIYNRTGVPESCECDFLEYASGLSSLLLQKKRCITLYKIDDEPELKAILKDDLAKIQKAGLVLAIPMFLRDRLTGIILLGPKISGDIFTREDMDTLLTVAGQTAVAVENARLHLKELQRQRAEGELLIARQIQQELLPKEAPQVQGLEIAGCSIPATEVGGDYFDYILQSDREPAEVMLPRGIGLGITTGEDFDLKIEEVTIPMQSGECFILYSDGLTEAMNPKLELFGEERLKELLDKNHQLPSMELRNLLVAHAREFQENEEQNDDITVVIVKIN